MDSAETARRERARFENDGYVLIRGFYSPAEVADLTARFARLIAEQVPAFPATDAFYETKGRPETLKYLPRLQNHDAYFAGMLKDPRFVELGEGLLGDGVAPQGIEWFNKCSRIGQPTPPHQDGYYYMIEPNEGVHFWMALDEVDEANGCIRYVRGSHRRGIRDHVRTTLLGFSQQLADFGPADEALEEAMIMRPGDMLVHHTLTIHRAGPNPSGRERRAMGLVYFAARAQVDVKRREEYAKKLHAELATQGKI
jgi:phytanoyl-CoA hydroxylase